MAERDILAAGPNGDLANWEEEITSTFGEEEEVKSGRIQPYGNDMTRVMWTRAMWSDGGNHKDWRNNVLGLPFFHGTPGGEAKTRLLDRVMYTLLRKDSDTTWLVWQSMLSDFVMDRSAMERSCWRFPCRESATARSGICSRQKVQDARHRQCTRKELLRIFESEPGLPTEERMHVFHQCLSMMRRRSLYTIRDEIHIDESYQQVE